VIKLQLLQFIPASKAAVRPVGRVFRYMWFDTQATLDFYEQLEVDMRVAPLNLPEQLPTRWQLFVPAYLETS